jgi:hypothetical protein
MSTLGSKLGGGGEHVGDAAFRRVDTQTSYPPPLPDAATSGSDAAGAVPADASAAPTIRPPPMMPAEAGTPPVSAESIAPAPPSAASAFAAPPDSSERVSMGFTSVIRHLSLRGWLRWIHSNRSDATLRVRTREGGSGRIWCNAGKIVDAEWGGLGGEEAMREMLSLSSGAVTIDFDRVDRPRRISRAMHELLHVDAIGHGRASDIEHAEAALAASVAGGVRSEPFRNSLFVPLSGSPSAVHTGLLGARTDPRRISRGEYLAGVFLLAALAIAAFAFGRMRAASNAAALAEAEAMQTEQTKAGLLPPHAAQQPAETQTITPKPLDLPLIPFVAIEVDPPRAEVWLDQELIGLGRVQLAAIRDGMMHELRFMAPGHETKRLFFRDTPPAGRVILERVAPPSSITQAVEDAAGDTTESESEALVDDARASGSVKEHQAEREMAKRAPRRRAPPPRATPPSEPPPAKSTQAKKSPQIQLIEVQTPRVQVLE